MYLGMTSLRQVWFEYLLVGSIFTIVGARPVQVDRVRHMLSLKLLKTE